MIEPHKHCPVCGTPIPMKERTCSSDCEKVLNQQQKNIKKIRIILIIVIIIFIFSYWIFRAI